MGTTITYGELDQLSRAFGAWLQQQGFRKGDRIAIMLPNMLAYPVAFLGALRAGLIAVNVNPLYTPRELKEQLADSGAEVIVIMENFAHKLETVIPVIQPRVDMRRTLMEKDLGSKIAYLETLQLLVEQQKELGVRKSHLQEAEAAIAAIRETRRQAEACSDSSSPARSTTRLTRRPEISRPWRSALTARC